MPTRRPTTPPLSQGRPPRGQVLVVFALAIVGLLTAAGLAVDIGRFYAERRFLQNAADAAALAAAQALIWGATNEAAEQAARDSLTRNFANDPNGRTPALPPETPVYASGHAGDGSWLENGIQVSGGEVRVAVVNTIDYTLGRAIGLGDQAIGARARARLDGDLMPIAVRRYINPPGPNAAASYPCTDSPNDFTDFFATADTACLGTESDAALRTSPNAGSPFNSANPDGDRANHGPIVAILGQGAQPNNGADFRGFIALDIRNFSSDSSQLYYNGVTSSTNANTLKAIEAGWISTGYPGPAFPPAISPPDPNDQVAVMSGNNTGIAIDALNDRYGPGSEILVAVYPGQVMQIPDFSLSEPGQVSLPASGTTADAGNFKVSRNQAFSGQVTLSTLADNLDAGNPMVTGTLLGGATPITFDPNPVTPSLGNGQTVDMTDVTTSGATPGIYALWLQGQAGSPYLTVKQIPFAVKIGTVTRDFTITADASSKSAAAVGDPVSFSLELTNAPNKNTAFGSAVALSVDAPTPLGVGAITFGSSAVTPTKTGATTTLTINTGTLAPGTHTFIVRATALNGDSTPRSVTHLLPLQVEVAVSGSSGNDSYVDIVGFAVMRVVAGDSNVVTAYAITPVIADMNDPQLRRGQAARLVPWD
jgi:hypothetical protein